MSCADARSERYLSLKSTAKSFGVVRRHQIHRIQRGRPYRHYDLSMTDADAGESPASQVSLDAVYGALAARRTQFDNLLWQVPVLCLTAQAFLFTIALGGDTARFARTIACLLSMVTSFLTVQILTRHRQAEITDAHWLAELETTGRGVSVHGTAWQARRNSESAHAGIFEPLRHLPGYMTWAWGLSLFGVAALVTLVVVWIAPSWLNR